MSGRRSRAALAIVTVCLAAAAAMVAQPLAAQARPNLDSAWLLPVLAPDGRPLVESGLAVWCSPGSRYRFQGERPGADRRACSCITAGRNRRRGRSCRYHAW